jgi:hypothetical protein
MVKALVANEPGTTPEVVDIILPDLGPRDVRVGIAAAGICHSDLSVVNRTSAPPFQWYWATKRPAQSSRWGTRSTTWRWAPAWCSIGPLPAAIAGSPARRAVAVPRG